MQSTTADASTNPSLWLVEHERENPMVLTQREHPRADANSALTRILQAQVANGLHVDPPFSTLVVGRRYDVHDANGWVATYWLSEERLAQDDGMLTAIVSPGATQKEHHSFPSKAH